MNPSFDDFITYDDQFLFKSNNTFDPEFSLSSPFSEVSDANIGFPAFLPKTIQNFLDPEPEPRNNGSIFSHLLEKPVEIQKSPEQPVIFEESPETVEYKEKKGKKTRSKVNPESKKITKREKAKERTKAKKTSTEVLLQTADPKHIPLEMQDPDLDSETRKKMVQMIRNRISAQNSRDRKKFYIQQLEEMRDLLTEENDSLLSQKTALMDKIKKLESERELFVHEISNLKKSLPPACSSCGVTLDYGAHFDITNQETTEDNSSRERSGESSPILQRGTNRLGRGFFGFSMTFTALLCLFFVLSSGEYRGTGKKLTTLIATRPFELETCRKPEEEIKMDEGTQTVDLQPEDFFEGKQFGFHSEENQILNKVRRLMDKFEDLHETFYKTYEKNKTIVDISKEKVPDAKLLAAAKQDTKRNFLEKLAPIATPNKTKNRTSTLFTPNGFEFFKANSSVVPDVKSSVDNSQNSLEVGAKTLDLEKAEYVQLVIPKHAIGRLGVGENSSEINYLPTVREAEEQNSLIEVWCKVFAVRDIAASF